MWRTEPITVHPAARSTPQLPVQAYFSDELLKEEERQLFKQGVESPRRVSLLLAAG